MYRDIACYTYISFDVFNEQHCSLQDPNTLETLERNYPFLGYADNNITFHLSNVEGRHYPETTSAIMRLLEDKGYSRAYCKAKYEIWRPLEIPRLNLSCAIGYEDAVRRLLEESDVDVNAEDPTNGLASLSWSVVMGHEAVVKRLLDEEKLDRNYKDSGGRTPLSQAIEGKKKENCA